MIDVQMVAMLLSKGADPNQAIYLCRNRTPWSIFLESCQQRNQNLSEASDNIVRRMAEVTQAQVVRILLEHGANPLKTCKVWVGGGKLFDNAGD